MQKLIGSLTLLVLAPAVVGQASKLVYGDGCVSQANAKYELFLASAGGTVLPDFMLSGTTITFLRTGNEYTVLDSIPGTFVPPSASATAVATGDDAFGTVALSTPMAVPGGVTNNLQVATNGYIHLTDSAPPAFADYSPTVAEFEAFQWPTICGPWYDWSPNQAGQILAEEVGGVVYITWDQVQPYNGSGTDTFQYQFELASGTCTIVFDTMAYTGASGWHTPLFGATAGTNVVSEAIDWSATLANAVSIPDVGAAPLSLDSNLPVIGTNWNLTTTNIDAVSPIAVTLFGDQQGPGLPLTAIGFNAPGCSVWINQAIGSLSDLNNNGSATVVFPIPNNAALNGFTLSAQSICLTLINPANILSSNGVLGTVGF